MPRHVSSPRMLSWRQRVAIGAPVLILGSVAAFALTSGDDDTPTSVRAGDDVAGRTIATSAPIATKPGAPQAGSSDPDMPRDHTSGKEPDPTPHSDRAEPDSDDEQTTRDSVARDEDSDSGTSPENLRQDDDESTIDPDTGDADGGSDDNGDSDDQGDKPDHTDKGETDKGGSYDADTIDRRDALRRCREALSGLLGLGGIGGAVQSCVDDLVGTPLASVDSVLDRTVGGLLSTLRDASADERPLEGVLCGLFGTCRDAAPSSAHAPSDLRGPVREHDVGSGTANRQ